MPADHLGRGRQAAIRFRALCEVARVGFTIELGAQAIPGRPEAGLPVLVRSTEVRILPREHFLRQLVKGIFFQKLSIRSII
jgi:hypothetical protein